MKLREGADSMDTIIEYFVVEKKETLVVAKVLARTIEKYEDIKSGFLDWLITREYSLTPEVGGYNAVKIHEMQPFLDAAGVYQFLVTLRDNPEKAQQYIDNNFPRK